MAVKASATITLSSVVDVYSTTRYYLLQSSTLSKPSKPTNNPPGGRWDDTEPTYTSGSTNSLYFVDLTVFSDDTWLYSSVSLSSSYEAAKEAYNKAAAAQDSADSANSTANDAANNANNALNIANGAVSKTEFERLVRVDTVGLHVGDSISDNEVLLDSNSVNVVIGNKNVSSFSSKFVRIDNMQVRKVTGGLAICVYKV